MRQFYLIKTFTYIWKCGKLWLIFTVISTCILGFLPIISISVTKELINDISKIFLSINKDFNLLFIIVLIFLQFLILITNYSLKHIQFYLENKTKVNLEYTLKKDIIARATSVSFHYFDQPEFYNHLKRIQGNQGSKFLSPINCIFTIMQCTISGIALLVYLISIHWLLVLMCIIATIPIILNKILYGRRFFWLLFMQTPTSREAQYTQDILTNKDQAKEIRIFNLSSFLIDRWSKKYRQNANESLLLLRKQKTAEISFDIFSSLIYSLATVFVVFLIYNRKVGIGDFVAIGQTISSFQNSIDTISSQIGKFFEDSLYIKDYFNFLNYEVEYDQYLKKNKFPRNLTNGILVKNVYFKYSNKKEYTIYDISFHIKKGEKIAIVGQNGSGKTTLIKCLIGLYPINKGKILFDDIEIENIDTLDLRQNIAVIFQDFVKYHYTVKDNIVFGDITNLDDNKLLNEVTEKVGADIFIKELKEKYNTFLGRFLNEGTELSGGQWQKIALSRALYNNAELIVLDEPTAALDPYSEAEIFNHFREIIGNKTAIFISHRMYSTKFADRVLVMKNGRLIEQGTHEELMMMNGEYTKMYNKQKNLLNNQSVLEVN